MSTTPRHTPGEWNCRSWDGHTWDWLHRPEGKADADLIDAAPDLLAACLWVLEGVRTMGSDWSDVAEEKLLAAIEKATGEATKSTTGPTEPPEVNCLNMSYDE